MQFMTAKEAKNQFGKFIQNAQREPVFVTKNNQPVGAFVSMEDLKGTYIAEAFITPEEGYNEWLATELKSSLTKFKQSPSEGLETNEAYAEVIKRFQERLDCK